MKKYILTIMLVALGAAFGHTLQERISVAAKDIGKIVEMMPDKSEDKVKFKEGVLAAIETQPSSPSERNEKLSKAKKVFADLEAKEQAAKILMFPTSTPDPFTGFLAFDAANSHTNSTSTTNFIWMLDEIDMNYGLDRKPRTMDKTKKYNPMWRRGDEPTRYDPSNW